MYMFDFSPQFFWLAFRGNYSDYNYIYRFSLFVYVAGMKTMFRNSSNKVVGEAGLYSSPSSTVNSDLIFINKENLNISYYCETSGIVNSNGAEEFYLCLG